MANWFCDTEIATGANDGSSMDDAWQSIKTALENVAMSLGDICWIRRRSNFYQPTAIIAPTIDGDLKNPIQFIGWPRPELKAQATFVQGSPVVSAASISPVFEKHCGRYIQKDLDGRNYLITAVAHKINYKAKTSAFTEGLMLEGATSELEAKIHRVVEDDTFKTQLLNGLMGHWPLDKVLER